ncbi:hypothetical protein CEE36_02595 [candidate division TA06 bacterium B3_TA06]|uniref:Endonuclease/exonuclease/phosphatase domain-containing protein n=1 Tax=candidate division TA06 bacterium B3_TA06 TaxID=2012487 RepID=A0A532VA08_UNCT6|nr:MAG: hypothetical protein CEE36_02595 [candidate division TA06 bacterium B3_TA06]
MHKLKLCSYNIKWMAHLFKKKGVEPLTGSSEEAERSKAIAYVIKAVDPDILGICEAPNSPQHLENWVREFLSDAGYNVVMAEEGFLSRGQQELAVLYKSEKVHVGVAHERNAKRDPFNGRFEFDTDDDRIEEIHRFYRPPLEALITTPDGNRELAMLMVTHTKSKGIFNAVDLLTYERSSRRNRLKLLAQCSWIRKRVDQWMNEDGCQVIVMGDFNDGPEMDYDERRLCKSAVEIVMGSIWEPSGVLQNAVEKPGWRWSRNRKKAGWMPASACFKDRFTEDYVNVLIDHVLFSQGIKISEPGCGRVWNPYQNEKEIGDKKLREALDKASDHYPVSVEVEIE